MTKKDYIKAFLDLMKIILGGLIGATILTLIYINDIFGTIMTTLFLIAFILSSYFYIKAMNELKDMP